MSVVLHTSGVDLSLELRVAAELSGSPISPSGPQGVTPQPVSQPDDPAPTPDDPPPVPVPITPDGSAPDGGPWPELHEGVATCLSFLKGICGFPDPHDDALVGALNSADFNGSMACGSCIRIHGPEGSVDIQIIDECPGCAPGGIDLNPAAFSRIASLVAGRVPITWQYIPSPVSGPIVYHFSDACNPYWTSVQVRNHRHAIASVHVQQGGDWVAMARDAGNYFVQTTSPGDGTLSFRVTDALGNVLEDSGVPVIAGGDASGALQFPDSAAADGE
ncbi:expansin EXLX1 family cellulose-binding protein [Microbacterium sp. NPDC019599]|uniref:expansin EXLX1 family cellulose-binding protein n=1 Tax=Microbacterium sp. NPDC019599 TaxID=3154690 RepID=UPI00340AF339